MLKPPRRLDVDQDEDFTAWRRNLSVFVNGERQSRVLAYDVDAGFVCRIATRRGIILVENGEAVTETIFGKVQVGMRGMPARA